MSRAGVESTDPILVGKGLVRSFQGRRVVDGVSIAVHPRRITGLLGPNGAGKTTTFRMLAGLLAPDGGRVLLDDREVTALPLHARARAGVGYLAQVPTAFRGLTVYENVALVLETRGQPVERARIFVERMGLGHLSGARAERLSGGERRRLEIARCLALEPRVMLLDEPFAGVDPVTVAELQRRVRELAHDGLGILLTDHAVREAMGVCHRICVLDGGIIQREGTPEEVAADPRVQERYLGHGFQP